MLRVLLVLILNADLRACCDLKAFCFGVRNPHSPWLCWLFKHLLWRGCVCWGYTWIPMIWETEKESHPWFSVVCCAGIWSSHEFVYMYTHSRKSSVVCMICIHVYTYIYMYVYMYICTYIHVAYAPHWLVIASFGFIIWAIVKFLEEPLVLLEVLVDRSCLFNSLLRKMAHL